MPTAKQHSTYLPQIALIIVTLVWGGTFLVVQHVLTVSTPMFFVGCRFAAAAVAVGLISMKSLAGVTQRDVVAGVAIGSMIALGYGMQTVGLQSIPSSESAFLTALYVPIVPILQWLVFGKFPKVMTWAGVVLAFAGLIFLTGNNFSQIRLNEGQLLTCLCAVAVAMEILLISYFSKTVNVKRVTVIQLAVASMWAFACMPLAGETQLPAFSWTLAIIAVGMGLASAVIQLVMNWAQRSVDPTRAAIIYAGEPVWAGIFGRIAGERLSLLGCALVVLGVLVSELNVKQLKKRVRPAKVAQDKDQQDKGSVETSL